MDTIIYNAVTATLLILMITGGRRLVTPGRIPWVAVALTALVVAGLVLQLTWPGAMDALDNDPSKTGWWRVVTSVFMQNGGIFGDAWNLVTIAIVAALAEWYWGRGLTLVLFVAAILLPQHIDALLGIGGGLVEPRNFAGSSGATYFLAGTMGVPLVVRGRELKERLIPVAVVVLGLATWFAQDNAHGLVSVYGVAVGGVVWVVARRLVRAERARVSAVSLR